jgi:hypothetical protein
MTPSTNNTPSWTSLPGMQHLVRRVHDQGSSSSSSGMSRYSGRYDDHGSELGGCDTIICHMPLADSIGLRTELTNLAYGLYHMSSLVAGWRPIDGDPLIVGTKAYQIATRERIRLRLPDPHSLD